tara:strand:+ start:54 stop:662 length:609 start_codon:yes stop_codon:yes gene_type:complete
MTNDDQENENSISKAGKFFSKKLDQKYVIDDEFENAKFRDLDDESLKISKIKARINTLRSKEKKVKVKITEKNQDKTNQESIKENLKQSNTEKFVINNSTKNLDSNSNPILNFLLKKDNDDKIKVVVLNNFEINSSLFLSGQTIEIPKYLIIEMISRGLARLLNKHEIQKYKESYTFTVNETFGLSELKKSKLNNNKKFSDN